MILGAIPPLLRIARLFGLAAVCTAGSFVVALPASAQSLPPQTADDQMGAQPFQSFHGGEIDHIGLANGTLNVDKEFLSYPQRGQLHLDFHLYYNNQPQHLAQFCSPTQPPQCNYLWGYTPAPTFLPLEKGDVFVGWAQQVALSGTGIKVVQNAGLQTQVTTHYERWSVQTADGAAHPLGNLGTQSKVALCPSCSDPNYVTVGTGPWESLDASGFRVNGSLTATDTTSTNASGSGVVFPDGVIAGTEDPNGNIITTTTSPGSIGPTNFTDTLGRQIPGPPTPASTANASTSLCPSGPLPVVSAVSWSVPGPNSGSSTYIFCYANVTINDGPGVANTIVGAPATSTKLQSIVLPDGHNWSFQYNDPGDGSTNNNGPINYGTLTQITPPTGGTISYTYTTTGSQVVDCQNPGRWVASRTVNANDGTGSHTWSYAYGTNSSGVFTTTVTDPLGNYSVHSFSSLGTDGCPAYETQAQYFQSGGTLLKTVATIYNSTAKLARNSQGPLNVVPTKITTTWPNGKTSATSKSYDSGFNYTDFAGFTVGADNSTPNVGIYGKELGESASDYGNNSAGATLRTASTNYLALSNSSYLTANMLDLVSSQSVMDGNGCKQAETDYTYDEGSYLTSYSGTLPAGTHVAPPNSVRGNPTSITHQLFAANSCPTAAQSGPTGHTNWYDTGEVYQAIDPLGHTTTHSYDPAYAGAYSTKTCNALGQCVSGTYDLHTGLLTSFTDANGSYQATGNTPGDPAHTTTLQYNDLMWRLTQIQSPADSSGHSPVTTIKYPDANTVERLKTITASLTDDSFSYFDGLGRHYKSVHVSAGNSTAVTNYDADGRVASVTNPYFSTSDPTYGVIQTQYDALGRATQTTKQDGSITTAQYDQTSANSANGDCTTATDEAGKSRKSCLDGLSRLIEVDEPQASTGSMANPYVTLYSYDALGNLLSVNQKGDGSQAARMRMFTYDSLSRLLTATNPESGTITYAYDADGNLLQKTSPAPNQTGTSTQTISYCYDALNRVTGKVYSAQSCPLSSPAVTYSYDVGTNGIGRLTSLTDQAGSGSYSYDVLGRISSEQRTINPGTGFAAVSKNLAYTYNLDGSVATLTYPSGGVVTYTPDSAGRILSAVDIANNVNYVTGAGGPNPSSGATYAADGSILNFNQGWTTSFAGIANNFSYNTRLQPVNMSAVSPGTTGTSSTAGVTIGGALNSSTTGGGGAPLAAANTPLASFVAADGSSHAFYISSNQHVWHLFWNSSGGWQNQDLTVLTGGPLAASGSSMTSVFDSSGTSRVYYLDANQHIHEMNCCAAGWSDNDMSAYLGTSAAAIGSALASTGSGQGSTVHVYYQGGNQHLYHMFLNNSGVWNSQDITAVTSTWSCPCSVVNAPAAGSALTSVVDSGGVIRVYFLDAHQHLNETYNTGSGWYNSDMTVFLGTSAAASGSALVSTGAAQGATVNVYYQGANQHLYRMFLGWQVQDVTAATGSAAPASGSAITSMTDNGGLIRTYFLDANQHVHETWCCSGGSYFDTDMTGHYNFAGAAAGSALTSFGVAAGNPVHLHYLGGNQHVWHMYLNSSGGWNNQDTFSIATVTMADAGTVSLNVGNYIATACFGGTTNTLCTGQPANNTPSQVASALAQALNASNSPVTATASGSTINMTWKATGPFTTPVSALSTTHDNPGLFPNPSFTSPATSFSGGSGANLAVFNIAYDFHLNNGDNGNVYGIINNRDTTRNQAFTYDALNRLSSARNVGSDCTIKLPDGNWKFWGNTYTYDPWGNLTNKTVMQNVSPPTCAGENLNVAALANNQLSGYGYDAAGNMTHDATTGNNYSFDAENRITGAAGYTYTYDADGNRVEKSNGSTGTIYWSMSPGVVAESDLTGALKSEYVFFGGERVARKDFPGNSVFYYFSDHLKTTSVITDSAGTIKEDEDYYPWGAELQFVNSDPNHYKFTGKERDSETQLDYFEARYYGNWFGRFVSPDWKATPASVPYAELTDPQSLNLYSYVRNRPTVMGDPDGHYQMNGLQEDKSGPTCGLGCWFGQWFLNATSGNPDQSSHSLVLDQDQMLQNTLQQVSGAAGALNTIFQTLDFTGLTSLTTTLMNDMEKGDVAGVVKAIALLPMMFTPEREAVTVYRIVDDGKTVYVGITNDIMRRGREHGADLKEIVTMGSRNDARAVEQALIEHYGLEKNGGQLLNQRNSISPRIPGFADKVQFGFEVLSAINYTY